MDGTGTGSGCSIQSYSLEFTVLDLTGLTGSRFGRLNFGLPPAQARSPVLALVLDLIGPVFSPGQILLHPLGGECFRVEAEHGFGTAKPNQQPALVGQLKLVAVDI